MLLIYEKFEVHVSASVYHLVVIFVIHAVKSSKYGHHWQSCNARYQSGTCTISLFRVKPATQNWDNHMPRGQHRIIIIKINRNLHQDNYSAVYFNIAKEYVCSRGNALPGSNKSIYVVLPFLWKCSTRRRESRSKWPPTRLRKEENEPRGRTLTCAVRWCNTHALLQFLIFCLSFVYVILQMLLDNYVMYDAETLSIRF